MFASASSSPVHRSAGTAHVVSIVFLFCFCSLPVCVLAGNELLISDPYVVKLERISKPDVGHNGKNFYIATVRVGSTKQEMRIVFDLSSGQVVLPSTSCTNMTCLKHHRYDAAASTSGLEIKRSGKSQAGERLHDVATIGLTAGELGYGEIKGNLMRETLCFDAEDQRQTCVNMGIVAAKAMDDLPYGLLPNDGFVGLGLQGLSISPEFNFFESLMPQGLQPQFAFYLGAGDLGGEITFGGVNPKRVESPMIWIPVTNPEEGYWQVSIHAIRAGDTTLGVCRDKTTKGCRGIIDAQTSHLSAPEGMAGDIEKALVATLPGALRKGCGSTLGLDLQLVLDGGATLTLPAENYAFNHKVSSDGASCEPWLMRHETPAPLGEGLFVFGESLLRRYYTVYDWEMKRIGFSLTAPEKDVAAHKEEKPQADQPLIFLLQLAFRPGKLHRK